MSLNAKEEPVSGRSRFHIEVIAGMTTFLTMAYIIVVNANILSAAGMDKPALITVTCLVTGLVTILTGLLTNAPIAMAPGMGMNAYFAYSLVLNQEITWQTALGIVFLGGLVLLILTVGGIRKKMIESIPAELLDAIAVGIGIFIAFMGLQNLGLVIADPVTLVKSAAMSPTILIGLAGLVVMVILELYRVRGSLLIGICLATLLAVVFHKTDMPKEIVSLNIDISPLFAKLDILGALKFSLLAPIFTVTFIDLFDSIGSLLGLAQEAQLMDKNGRIPKLERLLNIDAGSSMVGAVLGTSTVTTYIESASGIASGGRTGLTSIVNGGLFLLAILFIPVLTIVPTFATAPALILVGFFMMKNIAKIDFTDVEIGFPSFIIILMIALSYSISTGLAFGFLSYTITKIFRGKIGEIKPALWVVTLLCLAFFII